MLNIFFGFLIAFGVGLIISIILYILVDNTFSTVAEILFPIFAIITGILCLVVIVLGAVLLKQWFLLSIIDGIGNLL